MKNQEPTLAQALLNLSDAIEQLALILAKQKSTDSKEGIKKLSVITRKFQHLKKELKPNKKVNSLIKQKHRKGYLRKYLAHRNIHTGNYLDSLLVDRKLFEAANYLADHYRHLEHFYKHLKRNQVLKKDLTHKSNSYNIKYIRKWSEILHKNKLIDGFESYNDNRMQVDIAEIHKATKFINGYWLEVYLRSELSQLFRQNLNRIKSFDILAQVEVQMPDKKTSELDLLIMLNEKVYWFECKSGHIGSDYYKLFKKHRRYLGLPRSRSFLLVPDMNMHQAEATDKKAGMTLLYATGLPLQLEQIFFKTDLR